MKTLKNEKIEAASKASSNIKPRYNKLWIQLLAKRTNPKFVNKIKELGFTKVQNGVYEAVQFRNSVSLKIEKIKGVLKETPGINLNILKFTDKQHDDMLKLS